MRLEHALASDNPEIVREAKAMEWACEHGESYAVECLDPPIDWCWDTRGGWPYKRRLRVSWRYLLPWIGDRFRELAMRFRIWNNRRRGIVNPYRSEP